MNFMFSAGASLLLRLIDSLQIVCFQLMTRLDQPANVNVTVFIIWTLINFEIIDPSYSTALIFDFRIDEVYVERAREI